jgi:hypothetical protein
VPVPLESLQDAPPRRLRLSELLRELGALDDELSASQRQETSISVGSIVDKAQQAGFGFLLAVLALVAVPFVGMSTPFGLAVALAGGQMMFGRRRPWLPRRARSWQVPLTMLDRIVATLARRTRWLARMTRPRLRWLMVGPGWLLIGLAVVILGLGLALPLPIPGSNLVFLIPIFSYAIGVLEDDGLFVALGHLGLIVDLVLLVLFEQAVIAILAAIARWFGL